MIGLLKRFFRKDYKERVLPHSGLLEQGAPADCQKVTLFDSPLSPPLDGSEMTGGRQ